VRREDNRAIVRTASQTSKAAEFLPAFRPMELQNPFSHEGRSLYR